MRLIVEKWILQSLYAKNNNDNNNNDLCINVSEIQDEHQLRDIQEERYHQDTQLLLHNSQHQQHNKENNIKINDDNNNLINVSEHNR